MKIRGERELRVELKGKGPELVEGSVFPPPIPFEKQIAPEPGGTGPDAPGMVVNSEV